MRSPFDGFSGGLRRPAAAGGIAALPGILAVYDVSDLSSLFQERTGASATTPAVVNGPVGTLRDLSPAGNHLTAPTDAARPLLRQVGSLYYLEHDGADDTLASAAIASLPQPLYMGVALTKRAENSAFLPGFYKDTADYMGPINTATGSRSQSRLRFTGDGTTKLVTHAVDTFPIDTSTVAEVLGETNLLTSHINGADERTAAFAETFAHLDGAYITTTNNFGAVNFYGGVFRADTANSGTDVADIRAWLAERAGATLA